MAFFQAEEILLSKKKMLISLGTIAVAGAYYGKGSGPVSGISCSGTEHTLKECHSNSQLNCHHGRDVGVICRAQGNNSLREKGGLCDIHMP